MRLMPQTVMCPRVVPDCYCLYSIVLNIISVLILEMALSSEASRGIARASLTFQHFETCSVSSTFLLQIVLTAY